MLQAYENIELRKKTTLGLGGTVPLFYGINSEDEVLELMEIEQKKGIEVKFLGGGSNILVADESLTSGKSLDFAVAQMQIHYPEEEKFKEYFVWADDQSCPPLVKTMMEAKQTEKALRLEVGAGLTIASLLKYCSKSGASGLEGLGGVPGKVCGAIAMNAGAFGSEMDQVLETVKIYSRKYGFLTLERSDFVNSYRKFTPYFQGNILTDYLICGASFVFPYMERGLVENKIRENIAMKKLSQPIKARTAGCVFKNPKILDEHIEKIGLGEAAKNFGAGKILDLLGFKGQEKDGIRFSPIHANFIENFDNGSTKIVLEMIKEAKDKVYDSYNIILEEEIKQWL